MVLLPDDSSPSKHNYIETEMGRGTVIELEVRSEWNYGNNVRIGELVLWSDSESDALTSKLHNVKLE